MPQETLLLKPATPMATNLMKGFDPLHEKYILNDTIELSLAYKPDGLLGDDVPYSVSSDNTISIVLLCCFLLGMLALSLSRSFMVRQIKNFFYMPRSVADTTETDYEVNVQGFLILQTALTAGVFYYLFSRLFLHNDFSDLPQLEVIAIFTAVFIGYFVVKKIVYSIVDWVFFSPKNNDLWSKAWLFLTATEGLLLFPMMLLQVYFGIPLRTAIIYSVIVIILVKLLSFYKSYSIFFKRGGGFMQNILYFCALEMVPFLTLVGILLITGNYLKVNY